jgi:serine/threonine protein kinase
MTMAAPAQTVSPSAELLDDYLNALQGGKTSRCAALLRDHPELGEWIDCLQGLHRLSDPHKTLPGATPQPSPSSRLLGTQFGKYRLDAELGRGGMGIVYRAYQADLRRHVALKMILHGQLASSEQVARFLDEARASAHVRHPHVVQIHEVGEWAGQHYLAMEMLEGTSLDRLLASQRHRRDVVAPEEAVRFLLPLVRAVGYLHQQGIVHRDLKPGNILLQTGTEPPAEADSNDPTRLGLAHYTPKITDFGLAKSLTGGDGARTQSGMIVGTPSYMAPEQAASKRNLTHSVDLYALGAILYEILTGQPPYQAATPLDTLVLVLESEPAQPRSLRPDLPANLEAIVLKCLEKDAAKRYGNAAELADDLERFLAEEPVHAQPPSLRRRFWHWTRREPALASRVGALVALGGIVQLNYHITGNIRLPVHLSVMGLLAIWIVLSLAFQALLRRQARRKVVACCWSAVDILLFSLILMARGAETGPLIIGYPILVAMSGLWFLEPVVWFTTIAAEVATLTLLPYWHGWDYIRENPHHPVLVIGMIAVLGMVMAYQVQRVRSLSRFYGSRPWSE